MKWPLTLFTDAAFLSGTRRRAAAGFNAWAAKVAAGGPTAVARATAERVKYANDPLGGLVDYVAAPAVTWARRYGDCDDFAYLSAELLRRAGVESWLASHFCWNVKDSHVVCLFRSADGFGVLDQGLIRGHACKPYYESIDGVGYLLYALLQLDQAVTDTGGDKLPAANW